MKHALGLILFCALSAPRQGGDAPIDLKQTRISFIGHATLHSFNGEAQKFDGSALIEPSNPNLVTSAKLRIELSRMTTFNDARDRNMRTWFRVAANPAIEFQLKSVKRVAVSGASTHDSRDDFSVFGELTLNGVTQLVGTNVTTRLDGNLLIVDGSTQIDTTRFGLPIIHQFLLTVDKNVDVTFHLVFDLPAGGVIKM